MTRPALLFLIMMSALGCAGHGSEAATWTPPLGIPLPGFGIAEVAGAATHYVDNTNPAATDTANPNGSPDRPRATIPSLLPEGAVVEVRGRLYRGGPRTWTAAGTAARPAFIRGVGRPVIEDGERGIEGSYLIVEGFVFDGAAVRIDGSNVAFRHNEVRNYSPGRHSAAVALDGSDLVVYDNEIHHNGAADSEAEHDNHGVLVTRGVARAWIVDNHVHHNGGDSVQVNSTSREPWARHIYIGRNRFHEDRENAVDVKQARDVIVSQNEMWGYGPVSSSDGSAVVIHLGPERVWVIFNDIRDAVHGVRSNGSSSTYVVGNLIRRIRHDPRFPFRPDDPWSPGAAVISWDTDELHVVGNTIHDVDAGVSYPGDSASVRLVNNLISGVAPHGWHVVVPRPIGSARLTHTLFHPVTRIRWGGQTYDGEASATPLPNGCAGCVAADPLFVGSGNFRLREGSPAVDAGVEDPVYATFRGAYGLDISRDFASLPRLHGRAIDLGAFER